MSPKDHRHPEWEAQWRDTMTDYQSGPATEEDWSAMSALLDGGGAAPPDTTPTPGAGGEVSWSFLKWLLPALVTTTLATAFWYTGSEGPQLTAEEIAPRDTEEVIVPETTRVPETNTTLLPAESTSDRVGTTAQTEMAGFAAGQSRQAVGNDRASRVLAPPSEADEQNGVEGAVPLDVENDANDNLPARETEQVANQNLPSLPPDQGETTKSKDSNPTEETTRGRYRRIPRRMPVLLREYDAEKIWKKKIERQIANLRVKPQRRPKAENGLYPRVRVRY